MRKTIKLLVFPALLCALLGPGVDGSRAQGDTDPASLIERRLRDVFFDSNEYSLRADAQRVLDSVASILDENPGVRIIIEGYTDVKGEEDYNMELARRRTIGVKQYLVTRGIVPDRIITVFRGETSRFASGLSEEALQLNRRVRFLAREGPAQRPGAMPGVTEGTRVPREPIEIVRDGTAEPPPAGVPLSDAADIEFAIDMARNYLIENIDVNEIEFSPPSGMTVGKASRVRISLSGEIATALTRQLRVQLLRSYGGDPPPSSIDLELTGDGFVITRTGAGESGERGDDARSWYWDVVPGKPGVQSLLMRVNVVVESPGAGTITRGFPLIERVVVVEPNLVRSTFMLAADYIGFIIGIAVLGVVVWLIRR